MIYTTKQLLRFFISANLALKSDLDFYGKLIIALNVTY